MLTTMQLLNGVSASALLSGGDEPQPLTDPFWNDVVYLNNFNVDEMANDAGSRQAYAAQSEGVTLGTPAVEGLAVVSGSYLGVRSYVDNLGISDFTFECFVYRDLVDDPLPPQITDTRGLQVYVEGGYLTGKLISTGGPDTTVVSTVPYPLGEWVYICLERTGSQIRMYQGTLASGTASLVGTGTFSYAQNNENTNRLIGRYVSGSFDYWLGTNGGAIDNLRVTTAARYQSDTSYAIPSAPFPQNDAPETSIIPQAKKFLHFDASVGVFSDDAGTIPCVDGDPIAVWENQGSYPNAKQTVPSNRPTFKTGGHKGFPYIKNSDALDQYFEDFVYSDGPGSTTVGAKAVFAVVDNVDPSIFSGLLGSPQSVGGKVALYFRTTDGAVIHPFNAGFRTGGFINSPTLIAVNLTYWSKVEIRVNEDQSSPNVDLYPSEEVNTLEFLRCSGLSGSGNKCFTGDLYEFIHFTGGLTDELFAEITEYLLNKYDLIKNNRVSTMKPYTIIDERAVGFSAVTSLKPYIIAEEI